MKPFVALAMMLSWTIGSWAAQANEVNNGGIPPYAEYFQIARHYPLLNDGVRVGDARAFLLEHTFYQLKAEIPFPNIWNLAARVEVEVTAKTAHDLWLQITISNDWNASENLVIEQQLEWPSRTLVREIYHRVDGTVVEPPVFEGRADYYKRQSLLVDGMAVGAPTFRKNLEDVVTVVTPIGPRRTTVTFFDATWDNLGPDTRHTLKIWVDPSLAVTALAKIQRTWKSSSAANGDMFTEIRLTPVPAR